MSDHLCQDTFACLLARLPACFVCAALIKLTSVFAKDCAIPPTGNIVTISIPQIAGGRIRIVHDKSSPYPSTIVRLSLSTPSPIRPTRTLMSSSLPPNQSSMTPSYTPTSVMSTWPLPCPSLLLWNAPAAHSKILLAQHLTALRNCLPVFAGDKSRTASCEADLSL
jgi:hypothetical protein